MSSSRGIDRGKGTTFSRSTRIETYVVDREKNCHFHLRRGEQKWGKQLSINNSTREKERKKKKQAGDEEIFQFSIISLSLYEIC